MTRRRPQKRVQSRADGRRWRKSGRQSPVVSCRALMVIDSSKIRKKVLTDYKRSRTTFEKAEQELAEFESVHLPAYTQWFRQECGPAMEAIKTIQEETAYLDRRIEEIYEFAKLTEITPPEAAKLFHEDMKAFEDGLERARAEAAEAEARAQAAAQEKYERYYEAFVAEVADLVAEELDADAANVKRFLQIHGVDAFKSQVLDMILAGAMVERSFVFRIMEDPFWARVFAEFGIDLSEMSEAGEADDEDDPFWSLFRGGEMEDSTEDVQLEARVKALKRELAFALHPDQSDGHSPEKLELWHQVQEAAKEMDLDRLEVLQAHVQALNGELDPKTPVSRMQMLVRMYRESRSALRRRIRSLRKEPSWDFEKRTEAEKTKLRRSYHQHLKEEQREFEFELRDVKREMDLLIRQPKPAGEARDTQQQQFDFF